MRLLIIWAILLLGCGQNIVTGRGYADITYQGKLPIGPINPECNVSYQSVNQQAYASFRIEDRGASAEIQTIHLNELMLLPPIAKNFLRNQKATIYLTSGSITDFSRFRHLRGVVPRGWEDTGYTWDVVPGAGDRNGAYLGHPGLPNNAHSLALHEIGHTFDFLAGWSIYSKSWRQAYSYWKDKPAYGDRNGRYRMSHIEEFIASAIDDYYCSPNTRRQLLDWYPGVASLVEDSFKSLQLDRISDPDQRDPSKRPFIF